MALGARVGPERYLEVRYEQLVAAPEETIRAVCAFASLPYEPAMLDYAGTVDLRDKPHQQRLAQPPTAGVRDWRTEMAAADVAAFEEIAGDLLRRLGYDVEPRRGRPSARARGRLRSYRLRLGAFNALATAQQRSPLWRRRHPIVASRGYGARSAAERGEDAVGREEVGPLRRDHGRVLAHRQLPDDAPVRDTCGVRPLRQGADEHEVADHHGRAEDPPADRGLPQLPPGSRPKARRRPSKPPTKTLPWATGASCSRARRPDRSRRCPRRGRRARRPCPSGQRCRASAVGGRACIEALVAERVA